MSLAGYCLIARPNLRTGFFSRSVVYLYEDNVNKGSAGVALHDQTVIFSLNDLAQELGLEKTPYGKKKIYCGGPVNKNNVYLLHHRDFKTASTLDTKTLFTISSDITVINQLLHNAVDVPHKLFMGTSVWAPGQLKFEIENNFWLTAELSVQDLLHLSGDLLYNTSLDLAGKALFNQWI